MGTDMNAALLIGAELVTYDELFVERPKVRYGCNHQEKQHKYCPTCGNLATIKSMVKEPKFPLVEGPQIHTLLLDDKYLVLRDPEWFDKRVYVCTYMDYTDVKCRPTPITIHSEEFKDRWEAAVEMMAHLRGMGINTVSSTPSVFLVPFFS